MRRKVIYITILIIALLVCLVIFLTSKPTHRILIIQSYESTCKTSQALTSQIIKDFEDKGIQPDVRCCYLDCESFLDTAEVSWMNHLLDSVSADGWKPEVILVNEDQGTYSLLKTGHKLTRNTPIVFAGVNFPNWAQLKNFHNVTGFQDTIDILSNLLFIKHFRKSPQGLYTVLDSTFIDMKIRDEIYKVSQKIKLVGFMTPEIPVRVQRKLVERHGYFMLEDFPTRGKASRTAELLWNISYFGRDKSYLNLKRDFTTINIGRLNANYNFTAIKEEFGFGNNLLAGYFTPLKTQAADQVDYAVKILRGTPVSKLPVKKSNKKYMVDGAVMQSHHLDIDDFPANCEYIHLSLKEKHPMIFTGMFTFIGLLFIISTVYLVLLYRRERKRKKAAYNTVMREREVLKLALEGSNTFVWSLRDDLLTFDDSFCKYMGLPSQPIPLA